MRIETLIDKQVLVVGGGVTGASVVRYLARHEVPFDLVDDGDIPEALVASVSRGQVHRSLDADLSTRYDVIVLSPGIPRAHAAIAAAIEAGARVIGDIELFADATTAPVIAVTGSNGKSTVVAWLSEVLAALGVQAVACGNIGRPALDSIADEVECHVLELSSYQLESTETLAPLASTVLNVSDDHLDRYASLADYAEVKRRVYRRSSWVVVNADDAASAPAPRAVPRPDRNRDLYLDGQPDGQRDAQPDGQPGGQRDAQPDGQRDLQLVRRIAFSLDRESTDASWHRRTIGHATWLCHDDKPFVDQSELALPGDHNAANALAVLALLTACTVALERPVEAATLRTALCSFHGLPHRTELVGEANGVRWYNDSKGTNVDACVKAVAAMPGPVLLIAGGLAKGADFTSLVPVVARNCRAVVLIGRDRQAIERVLLGRVELHHAETLDAAVRYCHGMARAGDVVLLSPACASFDMFEDFEDRGRQFTASVQEALAA